MPDAVHGAAHGVGVGALGGLADLAEPECAKGVALLRVGAVGGLELGDLQGGHQEASTGTGSSASASGSAAAASASRGPCEPRTSPTLRPRSAATSSGRRRFSSAVIVAFTRLIGFCEPSDFDSTSRMPASSSTARTPPRSEEHTSELQSHVNLVCRLLLEKKKKQAV